MKLVLFLGVAAVLARARRGLRRTVAVALAILLFSSVLAPPASAQFGLDALTGLFNLASRIAGSILDFIHELMRPVLRAISRTTQSIQDFATQIQQLWEEIVWPLDAIDSAKELARRLIGEFRGTLNALYSIGVNSARLPNPVALETVMRNGNAQDQAQLEAAYRETFGAVPAAADAHPEERDLIDVDDALALDQLMTLKIADAAADRTLAAAGQIEDEAARAAPGTAAYLSAAAYLAALQSQAHLKKMIAGQMRQEAARLAHDTMALKRGAAFTSESRETMGALNQ